MKVVVRKYITGTFVETYEAAFDIPDDIDHTDNDAVLEYLENVDGEDLLNDANWGDEVSFDDSFDNVEYELKKEVKKPKVSKKK